MDTIWHILPMGRYDFNLSKRIYRFCEFIGTASKCNNKLSDRIKVSIHLSYDERNIGIKIGCKIASN